VTRFAIPVIAFLVLAGFLALGLQFGTSRELPSPLIGQPAPDFSLATLADPAARFTQEDLRGQVSLVNVWGTWCPECQTEHDMLMQIAASGIPVYGINLKDDDELARRWLRQFGNPYIKTGADPDGRAAIEWGVYGAPETFVVDARGIVRYKLIGALTETVWRERVQPAVVEAGRLTGTGDQQQPEVAGR
jgi:cytochrome c biogenesis protein CcmG/thiol:disulfide interchange protein DsbE